MWRRTTSTGVISSSNNHGFSILIRALKVEHQKFGRAGTVLASSEERIIIKFDDHGEKKFVTTIVMASSQKSDRQ